MFKRNVVNAKDSNAHPALTVFYRLGYVSSSFAVLVFSTLLIGCATPAEIRARTPHLEAKTPKTARDLVICVADKWESLGMAGTVTVNVRPIQGGYSVSWNNQNTSHTGLLIDAVEGVGGTTVRYFKQMVLGEENFDAAVNTCI